MAYPYSDPVWASDATFSSGPESGSNTKVDPGAGYRQQGFVPGLKFVGPYVNFLLNLFCSWIVGYLKDLHNQVEFLNKSYTWIAAHVFNGSTITGTSSIDMANTIEGTKFSIDHATNTFDYKTARADTMAIPMGGTGDFDTAADTWQFQNTTSYLLSTGAGTRVVEFRLPVGSVLTGMFVIAQAPSGTVSITLDSYTVDVLAPDGTVSSILGSLPNDTTVGTGLEVLDIGTGVTNTSTVNKYYRLFINASAASQVVRGVLVTFNNAGPR